jgi:hypothetical protein
MDAGRPLAITGLTAPGNGPMQFFGIDGKPVSDIKVEVGMLYERGGKGPKVLTRARADPLAMDHGRLEVGSREIYPLLFPRGAEQRRESPGE